MPGFGRAHGRMSRGNLAHTGGHEANAEAKQVGKDTPQGVCWGCFYNKVEPWEHSITCEHWHQRVGCASGT